MGRTARGNNWESVRLLVNPSTVSGTTGLRVAASRDMTLTAASLASSGAIDVTALGRMRLAAAQSLATRITSSTKPS